MFKQPCEFRGWSAVKKARVPGVETRGGTYVTGYWSEGGAGSAEERPVVRRQVCDGPNCAARSPGWTDPRIRPSRRVTGIRVS